MPFDAIVVGGGLSGLSAAVELTSSGFRVLLVEQKPHLGGRTYSFVDGKTGDTVDNGQHLLMGCYHETRRYLKLIGSDHLARLQDNLRIDFLHPSKGWAALRCPPLPAPFHILAALAGVTTVPVLHRLRLLRVGFDLLFRSKEQRQVLGTMTVEEWLTSLGQTEKNRKYLWDIIAIGSLNDHPTKVSALLFFRVLREAFLGSREDSCLLIPKVGLSELLTNPAREFLEKNGSVVRLNSRINKLQQDKFAIRVRDVNGNEESAICGIMALPHHGWAEVEGASDISGVSKEQMAQFDSSPIITINLWLDRIVLERDFVALLDSPVQWIFNKSNLIGTRSQGQYLSLVVSGARDYVAVRPDVLEHLALGELRRFLPAARNAMVVSSIVIKEKRATFSQTPAIEAYRPTTRTRASNLLLAGDWTDTGYPATIEGAVMSGFKAASEAKKFIESSKAMNG